MIEKKDSEKTKDSKKKPSAKPAATTKVTEMKKVVEQLQISETVPKKDAKETRKAINVASHAAPAVVPQRKSGATKGKSEGKVKGSGGKGKGKGSGGKGKGKGKGCEQKWECKSCHPEKYDPDMYFLLNDLEKCYLNWHKERLDELIITPKRHIGQFWMMEDCILDGGARIVARLEEVPPSVAWNKLR